MSQREAAERAGVAKRTYLAWENAKTGITWKNLERVADALGCSEDWLVVGDAIHDSPRTETSVAFGTGSGKTHAAMLARMEADITALRSEVAGLTHLLTSLTQRTTSRLLEELGTPDHAPDAPSPGSSQRAKDATTGSGATRRARTRRSAQTTDE